MWKKSVKGDEINCSVYLRLSLEENVSNSGKKIYYACQCFRNSGTGTPRGTRGHGRKYFERFQGFFFLCYTMFLHIRLFDLSFIYYWLFMKKTLKIINITLDVEQGGPKCGPGKGFQLELGVI